MTDQLFYPWREAPPCDFAVIGDPIGHSLSPIMQTAALRFLGRNESYIAVQVPEAEVAEALDHLRAQGTKGVNVTVPNKLAALKWSPKPDALSRRLGATNTLKLQTGEATNTDKAGFIGAIQGIEPGPALVLGAGGSARAVLLALEDAGFEVSLYNRTESRAHELVEDLKLNKTKVVPAPFQSDVRLVVNATSASLAKDTIEFDFSSLSPFANVVDLSYDRGSTLTAFSAEARNRGLKAQDGRPMLVYQGAYALAWWLELEDAKRVAILKPMAEAIGANLAFV